MKHYALPPGHDRHSLSFYLAMEEWIADRVGSDGGFFTWQVDPTVICGRNQDVEAEVDMDYCRAHQIQVYRRKSGGGCVFADRSNLMVSYICRDNAPIADIFARYTRLFAQALRDMGYDAQVTGRNDITIDGRKVSGTAFFRTASGASIVHGTLLHSSDMRHMSQALTPSRAKLQAKGVTSVEARVTTLSQHLPLSLTEVRDKLTQAMTDSEVILSDDDIREIHRLAIPYDDRDWLLRRRHGLTLRRSKRREGLGGVELSLRLSAARRIVDADLTGDFFVIGDIDREIIDHLLGVNLSPEDVAAALVDTDPSAAVAGLTKHDLIELIS